MTQDAAASAIQTEGPIIARPSAWYRGKFLLVAAAIIGAGVWFGYDGYIGWPRENAEYQRLWQAREQAIGRADQAERDRLTAQLMRYSRRTQDATVLHSGSDIALQKVLAAALPIVGLGLLAWMIVNTRGSYRLEGGIVRVPGHPPIGIERIGEIDKRRWDRKGIARLQYALADGRRGSFVLDDCTHERRATDQILERIEQRTATGAQAAPSAPQEQA